VDELTAARTYQAFDELEYATCRISMRLTLRLPMTQLPARDLHAALAFVDEAHCFADLESFRSGILPGLEMLVPCDLVGYNEVEPGGGNALVVTHPDPPLEFAGEALSRLAHQHPLIMAQAGGDDGTRRISDFLSNREFHPTSSIRTSTATSKPRTRSPSACPTRW
jgi:hypothetical protein